MNWDWPAIKDQARKWYGKVAEFYLFLTLCMYLLSCIVANHPVGIGGYVGFVGHVFSWRPPAVKNDLGEQSENGPLRSAQGPAGGERQNSPAAGLGRRSESGR